MDSVFIVNLFLFLYTLNLEATSCVDVCVCYMLLVCSRASLNPVVVMLLHNCFTQVHCDSTNSSGSFCAPSSRKLTDTWPLKGSSQCASEVKFCRLVCRNVWPLPVLHQTSKSTNHKKKRTRPIFNIDSSHQWQVLRCLHFTLKIY